MKKTIAGSVLLALAMGLAAGGAMAEPTGQFRFADQVRLVTMDPQRHSGGGIPYLRPVYESLFELDDEGLPVPMLATGYTVEGDTVTLTLREGVTFSNGEPFNAAAVVANINRGVEIGVLEGLLSVASAEAIDDTTVRITMREADPSIIMALAGTAGMMIAPAAMDDPALDRNPVGTGPFVYNAEESREGEVRVYTPNPTYWEPEEQDLARFEVWEIPDDTARLNALRTGQIDAGIWLSNPQAAMIDRSPDLQLIRNSGGLNYHVIISDRAGSVVPAFADRRVRQAMAYAINREAFNQAILFGLGEATWQAYPTGPWSNPDLSERYPYDPERARELLAEAGYADGFTFDMPSIPIYQSRLEALAGFFADVGITMNIVPVEPGTLARRSRTTDFPATNLVWNTVGDPKYLGLRYLNADGAYNPFQGAPSEDMAALVAQGLQSVDTAERSPAYRQMAAQIADEAFLIFVANTPILFGVSNATAENPTVHYRYGQDTIDMRGLAPNQ
ncbi:ABC transporter substrate-binding protein [Pararhodobacter sp. CCB-MM2]|uniref:ABC transporter substrate-binding protein n=1 Tax=Pararhodobacter sp. CCB-MM2 TaxID=1786003 RepID=UPI00082E2DD5|nr:ABC transporter substrate-binding protein [Pararhodobacter sp. CCB-MM2]